MTAPGLTQIDGLALKVEVLQHQDQGAALRGRLHPTAHLAALDVIPGGKDLGDTTEFSFPQTWDTRGLSQVITRQELPLVTVQIRSTTPSSLPGPRLHHLPGERGCLRWHIPSRTGPRPREANSPLGDAAGGVEDALHDDEVFLGTG